MTNRDAMYGAIARDDVATVRKLIARDPSVLEVRFLTGSWLHLAAQSGRVEIIAVLAHAGLPIDQLTDEGETPLDSAAGQGHYDACVWLLDHGADINHGLGESATPIFSAIFSKSLELVKLFVERGADLGATFGNPRIDVIAYATSYGTSEIVSFLRGRLKRRKA